MSPTLAPPDVIRRLVLARRDLLLRTSADPELATVEAGDYEELRVWFKRCAEEAGRTFEDSEPLLLFGMQIEVGNRLAVYAHVEAGDRLAVSAEGEEGRA